MVAGFNSLGFLNERNPEMRPFYYRCPANPILGIHPLPFPAESAVNPCDGGLKGDLIWLFCNWNPSVGKFLSFNKFSIFTRKAHRRLSMFTESSPVLPYRELWLGIERTIRVLTFLALSLIHISEPTRPY